MLTSSLVGSLVHPRAHTNTPNKRQRQKERHRDTHTQLTRSIARIRTHLLLSRCWFVFSSYPYTFYTHRAMCVTAWFDIRLNCFDRVWESIFHVLAMFPCSHAYANYTKCSVARFKRCLVNIYTSILTPTKTHWLPIKRAFNWIYPHAPGILFQSFLFTHADGYYAQLTDNFNSRAKKVFFFFNFLSFVFVSTENFEIVVIKVHTKVSGGTTDFQDGELFIAFSTLCWTMSEFFREKIDTVVQMLSKWF